MQVQFSLLNYILYRGGFSSSRPCVTANGEQRAPSSFAYALTRTPSLNDIPSRSSFLYSDRVIAYSDDYWFRNKSSNQMPSAAGCSTKVSGDTYAQRLSGSEGDGIIPKESGGEQGVSITPEGDGAYSNEGLSHTNLWGLHPFLPTCCLLTLPRQWLRNQGIGALRLPFSMVTSVKSLVLLGLRHSSTSADTHSQVDLRRSSRLSVRIIRLFQSPVGAPFIGEARKLCFNNFPFRGNPCRGVA